MPFKNIDLRDSYNKLMEAKENFRPQEEILIDLKAVIIHLKAEPFLLFVMNVLNSIEYRDTELFEDLKSPMRQMTYLIDVYYSIENRYETEEIDKITWKKITCLLEEMEMSYFVSIGFCNGGDLFHDERDNKVSVSLATFLNHFCNAQLSYEEQTLERLERYCGQYDDKVKQLLGISVGDAVVFANHLRNLNNQKLNDSFKPACDVYSYYSSHPDEWLKLVTSYEQKGISPEEWGDQPEIKELKILLTSNPGMIFQHSINEVEDCGIEKTTLDNLIKFLQYDYQEPVNQTIFYAGKNYYTERPLLKLSDSYICPFNKFVLESLYNRIDYLLAKDPTIGVKYKQYKDEALEEKVVSVFRKLFGKKATIFRNYSCDGKSEQDILVIYKGNYIVVEVKDCNFREPMRDPIKAYDRICRDFSSAIQKGYEQCKRMEDLLFSNKDFNLKDGRNMKQPLYHVKTNRVQSCFTIVVTQYRYGPIQTNLSQLLKKDEDDFYPWSVCVDDLESFVLILKKRLPSLACDRFVEFLEYRERYQEHLICFDELEMCGFYICERDKFKDYAEKEEVFNAFAGMTDIFEAYYRVGLGFDNELDIECKKHFPLPDYASTFDVTVVSGSDFKG